MASEKRRVGFPVPCTCSILGRQLAAARATPLRANFSLSNHPLINHSVCSLA